MSQFVLPPGSDERCFDCIIVGAGLSGLQCARSLIDDHGVDSSDIIILEAQDYIGGRVKQDVSFVKGTKLELGAEILHGDNTKLTQFAKKTNEPITEAFCWAQGDGGPYDYAVNGCYGLYYVGTGENRRLIRYDDKDPEFVRLNNALKELGQIDENSIGDDFSVLSHLKGLGFDKDMLRLASAGFSNTFCSTSETMSLKQVARSQRLWHGNDEDEREFRLKNSYSCVIDHLNKGVNVKLNTPVANIDYTCGRRYGSPSTSTEYLVSSDLAELDRIKVTTTNGTVYYARSVVVTSSPKVLLSDLISFTPSLPLAKIEGLQSLDMYRAMKVIFKFKKRFFPIGVQGIVMAGDNCIVPEMWFKIIPVSDEAEKAIAAGETVVSDEGEVACTATCFACANYADHLVSMPQKEMLKAILDQLDEMFSTLQPSHMSAEPSLDDESLDSLCKPSEVYIDAMVHDWSSYKYIGGGYACGRKGWNLQKAQVCLLKIESSLFVSVLIEIAYFFLFIKRLSRNPFFQERKVPYFLQVRLPM